MGSKSVYLEKKILDYYFGASALSAAPSTLYFALFTTSPTEGNDSGVEVSGGSYARCAITNNATNFTASTQTGINPAVKVNSVDVSFIAATANWGTIIAFGIYDALTSGNLLYWGAIDPSSTILSGESFTIPIGQLNITET